MLSNFSLLPSSVSLQQDQTSAYPCLCTVEAKRKYFGRAEGYAFTISFIWVSENESLSQWGSDACGVTAPFKGMNQVVYLS